MARVTVPELFSQAGRHFHHGQLDDAQRACKAILKKQPRYFPAHYMLALVEFQRGDLNKAVTLIDRCLLYKPDYPEALSDRGVALCSLGRHAEALASYDKRSRSGRPIQRP
jgi:tetratricopeptide (TPR) repeat protein